MKKAGCIIAIIAGFLGLMGGGCTFIVGVGIVEFQDQANFEEIVNASSSTLAKGENLSVIDIFELMAEIPNIDASAGDSDASTESSEQTEDSTGTLSDMVVDEMEKIRNRMNDIAALLRTQGLVSCLCSGLVLLIGIIGFFIRNWIPGVIGVVCAIVGTVFGGFMTVVFFLLGILGTALMIVPPK